MSRKQTKLPKNDLDDIKKAVERGLRDARQHARKKGVKGIQQYKTLIEDELLDINHRLRIPSHEGK